MFLDIFYITILDKLFESERTWDSLRNCDASANLLYMFIFFFFFSYSLQTSQSIFIMFYKF